MTNDEELRRGKERATNRLEEESYFVSAMRYGPRHYTSVKLSTLFEALTETLGGGYLIETDKRTTKPEADEKTRKRVAVHETARHLENRIAPLATIHPPNAEMESPVPESIDEMIHDYVKQFRRRGQQRIITNEQLVINFSLEYFAGLKGQTKEGTGNYSLTEKVFSGDNAITLGKDRTEAKGTYVSNITMDDVIGLEEQKTHLRQQLFNPLKNPEEWERLKKTPKKIVDHFNFLFWGGSGTGKTHLAKGIAGELDMPFYAVKGTDFIQSLHGEGKNLLAQTYTKAREQETAIIYIDEAEIICPVRGTRASEHKEDVTNEFLMQLDGINTTSGVSTIIATNRPDIIDPSTLQRFPKTNQLYFAPLDGQARKNILLYQVGLWKHEELGAKQLEKLLGRIDLADTRSMTHLTTQAALYALDRKADKIGYQDLERAITDYEGNA